MVDGTNCTVRDTEGNKAVECFAKQAAFLDIWLRPLLSLNVRVADQVFDDRALTGKFAL